MPTIIITPVLETFALVFVVALGCFYLAYRRKAVMWGIISVVLFTVNTLFAGTIPFEVDDSGQTIGTSSNIVLIGLSLVFVTVSLLYVIQYSFEFFKQRKEIKLKS